MTHKIVKIFFCILVLSGAAVWANVRVRWVEAQGFPYLIKYSDHDVISKYCYGEIEDVLTEKKMEILCRSILESRCPEANDCYAKRAVDGVIP